MRETERGLSLAGNVGGAVLSDGRVHRPPGPWTPAGHTLLRYLHSRLSHIPRVLGFDENGHEVLSYLPGKVVDIQTNVLTPAQLVSLVRWTPLLSRRGSRFHPSRILAVLPDSRTDADRSQRHRAVQRLLSRDKLVGVFDRDMSGPSTPLAELASWTGIASLSG